MSAAEPYLNEIRKRADAKMNRFDFSTTGVTTILAKLHRRSITAQKNGFERWETNDIRLLEVVGKQLVVHCRVAEEMAKTSGQPSALLSSAEAQKIVGEKVESTRKTELKNLMSATARILGNMETGDKPVYVANVTTHNHVELLSAMIGQNIKAIERIGFRVMDENDMLKDFKVNKDCPTKFEDDSFDFSDARRKQAEQTAKRRLPSPQAVAA